MCKYLPLWTRGPPLTESSHYSVQGLGLRNRKKIFGERQDEDLGVRVSGLREKSGDAREECLGVGGLGSRAVAE